jgi:hypothetical protein
VLDHPFAVDPASRNSKLKDCNPLPEQARQRIRVSTVLLHMLNYSRLYRYLFPSDLGANPLSDFALQLRRHRLTLYRISDSFGHFGQ